MSFLPPPSTWMRMRVEAASREFSKSSFTTEAGRSTTSPAAILLGTCSGRTWILPITQLSSARNKDARAAHEQPAEWDPSLRSGFRLRAPAAAPRRVKTIRAGDPAALTPANRLNFASGDLVGNVFGEDVDLTHGQRPVPSG